MNSARGFTLIEILIALTLFAVVGGTLLQLFQSGLRTARLADDRTHAVFLARSKLAELQAHTHLEPGILSGSFEEGYRWEAILSEARDDTRDPSRWLLPLALTLTVSWGESGEQREFTLRSLLLSRAVEP